MNKKSTILSALAVAGIALLARPALAGTIVATYSNAASFGAGPVGYEVGDVTPNPNSATIPVAVGIGGDTFTTSNKSYDFSSTGSFNTWCVDIYHWAIGGPVTYTVETGTDLASTLSTLRPGANTGAMRVAALGTLANEVYSSVNNEVSSAAFQLAVWAITYGTADGTGHYHVGATDANFKVDAATAGTNYAALANTWLANLGDASNTGNYELTYLADTPVTQNMVVFTSVPEPGTFALAAIGLAGLGLLMRKRA